MIGIFWSILAHVPSFNHFLGEPLFNFLYFYSMLGVVDERNGRILTFLDKYFLSSLVFADDDFIEYFRDLFHSLLPEIVLLGLIPASMVLNHIFGIVDNRS